LDGLRFDAMMVYELPDLLSVAAIVKVPQEASGTWYRSRICPELKSIVQAKSPGQPYLLPVLLKDQVLEHDILDPASIVSQ
jgi:hypothetical protein